MSNPTTRLLLIGIDAASPVLLERWAAGGELPVLAELMSGGHVSRLRSVDGFHIGATWPSLYTGRSPAGHGFHYLAQLRKGTYDFYWPAEEQLVRAAPPFWDHLDHEGCRVAVLDVPLSSPQRLANGCQIVEWGGHDVACGFSAFPAELGREVLERFGRHPLPTPCDGRRDTAEDYRLFVDTLVDGVQTKARLTRSLLQRGGWDLFMQVFTEAHCAGHQSWHLHDRAHPAHDPEIAAKVGDPLKTVYRAIDAAIGDVIAAAEGATVIVFSGHGMAHWYGAQFLMPDILFRLGVAEPAPISSATAEPVARAAARAVWQRLPPALKDSLGRVRDRMQRETSAAPRLPSIAVDPNRSLCFPHPNGLAVGGIRLNLAGREPLGQLEPGAPADAFCRELTEDLLAIMDARTKRPVVSRVLRTADLYHGPFVDELPDLLVEWDDEVPTGSTVVGDGAGATVRVHSPKTGTIEGRNRYGRTGEHRSEGFLVAAGPGIAPGRATEPSSILDIVPSVAGLLNVEIPGCEGRAIEALVR